MSVLYKSTRGKNELIESSAAIIRGIAEDGGLYVPDKLPTLSIGLKDLVGMKYSDVAFNILKEFLTDFTEDELRYCVDGAYDKKFDTEEIAPVKKVGDAYFLELFHGPTIAFKDMALSILPYLLTTAVKKQKMEKEIVILTATSGDTGKAALEGFSDVKGIKIIVFFPEHGVSEIQKMQMRTHVGSNTYVVGIEGNFDDAQNGVKYIFNDAAMKKQMEENNYMFSSANSINIGRLVPQVAYYFYAYAKLVENKEIDLGDSINVVVPTGNFGNILAAYYAKNMGLPINKLICASNENKVLFDFINTGIYDKRRDFILTSSPSMDILISSNLERLLFSLSGNNAEKISSLMTSLSTDGVYEIDSAIKTGMKDFFGEYASEEDTFSSIKELFSKHNYLMDTHTAVGYASYKKYVAETGDKATKTVIASTASPYKFPQAVMGALKDEFKSMNEYALLHEMTKLSSIAIPNAVKDIDKREILHNRVCEKGEMMNVVKDILTIK